MMPSATSLSCRRIPQSVSGLLDMQVSVDFLEFSDHLLLPLDSASITLLVTIELTGEE